MPADDYEYQIVTNHNPITLAIEIADTKAKVTINAQYSPDIIDDLTTRLTRLYAAAITIATSKGYTFTIEDEEDDDDEN